MGTEEIRTRQITFNIETAAPLPAGEQVFISGNAPELGDWHPAGLPLTRVKDNLWSRSINIPQNLLLKYKVTRGNWASEEVTADEYIPKNKTIDPGEENKSACHWIHHWKDLRMGTPPEITGYYDILENISSNILGNTRKVVVWLPPSYYNEPEKKYPVLYMQDGQQVFDPNTSTWNQAWNIDEWCTALIEEKQIPEMIVVAPYCNLEREFEYNPEKRGDSYIDFLTKELMPTINHDFQTLTGAENTAIAGASLGGSIAFYAAWKHPDIFSKAACLSPAFPYEKNQTTYKLVKKTKKKPSLKLYLYCGCGDEMEQAFLPQTQEMMELLSEKKFISNKDLLYVEDEEAEHTELAWNRHSGEWLLFLFS